MVSFRKVMAVATAMAFAAALFSLASNTAEAAGFGPRFFPGGGFRGGGGGFRIGGGGFRMGGFGGFRPGAVYGGGWNRGFGPRFYAGGFRPWYGGYRRWYGGCGWYGCGWGGPIAAGLLGGLALGAIVGDAGYYGDGYSDYGYGYGPGGYDSGYGCHLVRDPVRGHNGHVIYYQLVRVCN
jgi:hypothetical protein